MNAFWTTLLLLNHIYYVSSSTGNDSNDGLTPQSAWQSLAKVNATTLVPGQMVRFKGGDLFTGTLTISQSGNAAQPITINSYGTGRAVILPGDNIGIQVLNSEYVNVDNMKVTGSGVSTVDGTTTSRNTGIAVTTTAQSGNRLRNVNITNNYVSGTRVGILLESNASVYPQTSWRGYDGVLIQGNEITLTSFCGIFTWAQTDRVAYETFGYPYATNNDVFRNVTLRRNYVHDCYGYNSTDYAYLAPGTGIRMENVNGGLVEYCVVDNCGHAGVDGGPQPFSPANFEAEVSQRITWQYCESSRCVMTGNADGAGFDVFDGGCTDGILQYCYAHDNDGYGVGGGGVGTAGSDYNIARFNVLVNNNIRGSTADVQLWGYFTGLQFYNNTVYSAQNGGYLVSILAPVTGVMSNNIFVSTGTRTIMNCPTAGNLPSLVNNLYWRGAAGSMGVQIGGTTYNTMATLQAASYEKVGGSNYGVNANPLFVSAGTHSYFLPSVIVSTMTDYDLQSSSAAKNAGITMTDLQKVNEGSIDFHNAVFSTILNIGANQ